MKLLRNILVFLFLLPGMKAFTQGSLSSLGFWHQQAFSGKISLEGKYRESKSIRPSGLGEIQRGLYGIAGISLYSKSYLWSPDLMTMALDLELNPETQHQKYIQIPNFSEVRTQYKFGFKSTIFNNKPITFSPYFNYNETYYNRENLTNIRSKSMYWGGDMLIKNKFAPITLSYNNLKWRQEEIESGRLYTNDRKLFQGEISKSFSERDKNVLNYGYEDLSYNYTSRDTIRNTINRLDLNNQVFLNILKKNFLNSRISFLDQKGTNYYKRLNIFENVSFNLPNDFSLSLDYTHYRLKDRVQDLVENRAGFNLDHKLFLSLSSNLFAEYSYIKQTYYDMSSLKAGIGFDYTKKILIGQLNFSYYYYWLHRNRDSESTPIQILNEAHVLNDGGIELLDLPYADINSVVVKDITGTTIYQLYFDYILIERENFIEIQRIIGGQIQNGGQISVDYVAIQSGSYKYDLHNHNFVVSILLFNRMIEVYYRFRIQDYSNIMLTDFLTLNYYSQNIFGVRFDKRFINAGMEYETYLSNIIPYKRFRIYLDINKNFNKKLLLSLTSSFTSYNYIRADKGQIYGNLNSRVVYVFKRLSRAELVVGYLSHKSFSSDLSLWTGRLEYSTIIRKLQINASFDFYRRVVIGGKFSIKGFSLKVSRQF